MKQRIVIKVGTSLTTLPDGRLNLPNLARLSEELSHLHDAGFQIALVSSGAVAAGRRIMHNTPHSMPDRQALSSVGQPILMEYYRNFFRVHDKYVGQCLCTSRDFHSETGKATMKKVLESMLKAGIIPIINENDATSDEELTFGDNDQLASHIAILVGAEKLIILSDVSGLYDKNPQEFPDAQLLSEVAQITPEIEALAGNKVSPHSMGGMKSKLQAFKRATEAGLDAFLLYGREAGLLQKVLLDHEKAGTFFPAIR